MSDSRMYLMHGRTESHREIAKSHHAFKIIDPGA